MRRPARRGSLRLARQRLPAWAASPAAYPAGLAAVLVVAAVSRLVGLRYGLPYPLLNPDEANIVPRAWRIGHGETADPGFYDYPSLLFYLLAPTQSLADDPSYLAARSLAAAIGVLGVAAAWWLGRAAAGRAAGLLAAATVAVATTHVAYSHVAVTDVLLTLGLTAAIALAVAGRIELAGLAVGLAVSAKYPGILAAVPVLVAGWPHVRRLVTAAALAVAAYALTSPFTLVNFGEARDDLDRVQSLARRGWLGFEDDPPALVGFGERLWEAIGPVAALAALGLLLALRRPGRREAVVVSFVVAYGVYLATLGAHFDRYVLPLVPVAGLLAARLPRLALVLLVVPAIWTAGDVHRLTRADTRLQADAWIAANVPPNTAIAADPSTLPLDGRPTVRLELPGPGRPFDERRSIGLLRSQGVRYVLVSGVVTDRVLAARSRYPREARFYDTLARTAVLGFEARPGGGLAGPWVRVYALP